MNTIHRAEIQIDSDNDFNVLYGNKTYHAWSNRFSVISVQASTEEGLVKEIAATLYSIMLTPGDPGKGWAVTEFYNTIRRAIEHLAIYGYAGIEFETCGNRTLRIIRKTDRKTLDTGD